MAVKDWTRWQQNADGSYSRRLNTPTNTVVEEGYVNATQGAVEAAEKLGVDLGTVSGTGAEGRVTKADVEAAASA